MTKEIAVQAIRDAKLRGLAWGAGAVAVVWVIVEILRLIFGGD